jgi:hypothetical protein
MLCSLNKLVEAIPRSPFEIPGRTLVDHPPDVTGIMEKEPFKRSVRVPTKTYGVCHRSESFPMSNMWTDYELLQTNR